VSVLPPEPVPVPGTAAPGAFAEPVEPVPRRWVAWVTLAGLGLWAGFFGPIQVLLAQQAGQVAPGHKELVFGVVTGVGSAVAVVANPVFGALSDLGTLLLYFYLQDQVRYPDPEGGVFVLTVVYAVFIVASTVLFGLWSDRLGRRKVFVTLSGAVTGLGALVLAVVPTWPGALTGAVVFGIGYGVYLSVDFALCTQVLPSAEARAKDLGLINIAVTLPAVFAPFVGSFIVARVGGYVMLYAVATGVCLLGSVLVRNIRSVR
jgi:Major Facilitator Superfamily